MQTICDDAGQRQETRTSLSEDEVVRDAGATDDDLTSSDPTLPTSASDVVAEPLLCSDDVTDPIVLNNQENRDQLEVQAFLQGPDS